MIKNFKISTHHALTSLWPLFVFLTLFGGVLNNIIKCYSLPNIFTIARVIVLGLIFILTERNSGKTKCHAFFYIAVSFFVLSYLSIAFLQGRLGMGFYFIRLYIESLLVLYLGTFIKRYLDINIFVENIKKIGLLSVFISLVSVFCYYLELPLLNYFHGNEDINYNWFLIGRFVYRAGFPIGGPNQLGLLYTCLIILSILFPYESKRKNSFYLLFFSLGLLSSFSKSSLLVLFCFCFFYYSSSLKRVKTVFYIIPFTVVGIAVLMLLDVFVFDGMFSSYIDSLMNLEDGSTLGHFDSIVLAVNNFGEYYQFGYLKGTVGPRAQLFTSNYVNVESSIFIVLYDMGLIVSFFYFLAFFALVVEGGKYKFQIYFLIAIFIQYMVLPIIHSIEITSFVFVCYLLLGNTKGNKNSINFLK